MLMKNLGLVAIAALRRSGKGMVIWLVLMTTYRWLRTGYVDLGDFANAFLAFVIYLAIATFLEYRRPKVYHSGSRS